MMDVRKFFSFRCDTSRIWNVLTVRTKSSLLLVYIESHSKQKRLCGPRADLRTLGPIQTMRHVSVPSPFHLRSVRILCVHTVRPVHSPSRTARDRRRAII